MNKVEKLFLYITSTLLFLSMFLMGFSSVCHAETTGSLPYVVPSMKDLNSAIPEDIILNADSLIRSTYNLDSDDTILYYFQTYDLMRPTLGEYEWNSFTFLVNPSLHGYTESFDYISNQCNISFVSGGSIEFKWTSQVRGPYGIGGGTKNMLGTINTNTITQGTWTPDYPFYMTGPDVYSQPLISEGSGTLFFTNTVPYTPDVPGVGHATQPTNDPNNFINGSNGLPVTRPTSPTINNYTWNTWTSPTVDTSSVESLLESLIDVVSSLLSWLGSNISGEFNNLVSNLQNLFNFLVQGIENGFNKVISSIQGLGTDLYNNFVSLFEPITQQLAYITSPVDTDLIQSEVESTSLMSDYSEVVTIKDSFVSVFNDTSEPSSFTIPIHLENLSMLNVGTQYIDLSVINPVKSALRTFIWVLVSFGLVVTIIDSIPNYINGGGDE